MQRLARTFRRGFTSQSDVESFVLHSRSATYQQVPSSPVLAGFHSDSTTTLAVLDNAKDDEFESSSEDHELDGIHDGLEFPSEQEKLTLRRVADEIPWNAYLISIIEMAERFSYYGSSVVFVNFIQQPLPRGSRTGAGLANGQSGALGLGQQASTGLTTFYTFWCYVVPLFGAYVADTHWGRFKTISISVWVALLGHAILIIAALPGIIDKPTLSVTIFAVALVIMGLGTGGFKANISPLVAEQYKKTKLFVITRDNGERVIVDPILTTSRIYMYFYLFINIGTLVGQISMAYAEKYVGFWLAYTFPTIVFLLCPLVLFAGRKQYVHSPPAGTSVLLSAVRLWIFATRGRWSANPVRTWRQLRAPGFWEDAKPSKQSPHTRPKWMKFDDAWVDEVRTGFNACTVFCWFPVYLLIFTQFNNLTSQAATLATHGLPNDVLPNIDPVSLIILIPLFDRFVYPSLRRVGINFSPLKRITAGFAAGCAAMVWAAIVQYIVYQTNPCHYSASTCVDTEGKAITSSVSVWIQTGSYFLIALSEMFAYITGLEYAYTKAPKNMRSLVMSIFLFTSAVSSAVGEAFVSLATDPLLVWAYGTMAALCGGAGVLFWLSVRGMDAEDSALSDPPD